jgi:hypothetical protein
MNPSQAEHPDAAGFAAHALPGPHFAKHPAARTAGIALVATGRFRPAQYFPVTVSTVGCGAGTCVMR